MGEFKSGWMVNNVIYIQTNGGTGGRSKTANTHLATNSSEKIDRRPAETDEQDRTGNIRFNVFYARIQPIGVKQRATNMGKSTYNRVLIHQISYARVLDIQGKVEERSCATESGILIEYKTDPDFVPVSLQW